MSSASSSKMSVIPAHHSAASAPLLPKKQERNRVSLFLSHGREILEHTGYKFSEAGRYLLTVTGTLLYTATYSASTHYKDGETPNAFARGGSSTGGFIAGVSSLFVADLVEGAVNLSKSTDTIYGSDIQATEQLIIEKFNAHGFSNLRANNPQGDIKLKDWRIYKAISGAGTVIGAAATVGLGVSSLPVYAVASGIVTCVSTKFCGNATQAIKSLELRLSEREERIVQTSRTLIEQNKDFFYQLISFMLDKGCLREEIAQSLVKKIFVINNPEENSNSYYNKASDNDKLAIQMLYHIAGYSTIISIKGAINIDKNMINNKIGEAIHQAEQTRIEYGNKPMVAPPDYHAHSQASAPAAFVPQSASSASSYQQLQYVQVGTRSDEEK